MRIRTAIFGVYVAASAVGLVVLMRFMLAEVRPRYVAAVRQNLTDSSRVVALALAGRTLAEAKAALAGQTGLRVRLLSDQGVTLYDSVEAPPPEDSENWSAYDRGLAKRAGARLLDGGATGAELEIAVTQPLQLSGISGVRLEMARSFRSVNAVIWTERKKLALIALIIAAAMVVAGWWITARLTHSLERLTRYVQDVRDGRAVKPPTSRATEIAELAKAFEEMRDALEGRQHVERYTQALAHEVKAPLAAIRGAAELLGEEMPAAQREKFLGNIRGENARIQQIIDRLLELSSLEARKALRQTETIDLGGLMGEAAAVLAPAYSGAKVALETRGVAGSLKGERVLLREALVNLLQNALDFSPAGSTVSFSVEQIGPRLIFAVEDQGAGVPDYALARVFERFYSLPRPGTTRKSTGLGLALVKEIAHLHGGGAALENRPGGGARATLWVPA